MNLNSNIINQKPSFRNCFGTERNIKMRTTILNTFQYHFSTYLLKRRFELRVQQRFHSCKCPSSNSVCKTQTS